MIIVYAIISFNIDINKPIIYNLNMSDIIKVENNEFFIDSEALSDLANIERRSITRLITNYMVDLEQFGVVRFEITKPNEQGGRPKTIYLLNEQQATLLTTFMKNSEIVREFKYKLVNEFFKMREFINNKNLVRALGIESRKGLTEIIQESGEHERMHKHGISTYTNMAYELTGLKQRYKEYKKENPKSNKFRETLNSEELKNVEIVENMSKSLIETGRQYNEIKATLEPLFKVKEIR